MSELICERCKGPAWRLVLRRCDSCAYPDNDGPYSTRPPVWVNPETVAREAAAAAERDRRAAEWPVERIRAVMASAA